MNLTLIKSDQFNDVKCDFYNNQGSNETWMTRDQIGTALEYLNPRDAIYRIHERNKNRLDKFSTVVKLSTVEGGRVVEREVFLYSTKGVYEICRWSRQPKADAFMDWVWDMVEAIRQGKVFSHKSQVQELVDKVRELTSELGLITNQVEALSEGMRLGTKVIYLPKTTKPKKTATEGIEHYLELLREYPTVRRSVLIRRWKQTAMEMGWEIPSDASLYRYVKYSK